MSSLISEPGIVINIVKLVTSPDPASSDASSEPASASAVAVASAPASAAGAASPEPPQPASIDATTPAVKKRATIFFFIHTSRII